MKEITLGITGHRKILNESRVIKTLNEALEQLAENYKLASIVSPLAEGADRLVAKILMDHYNAKLMSPLPFEVNAYKNDFTEESKKEFETLLIQSSDIFEVASLEETSRNDCYMKVGQVVVDRSDVLLALWDGKEAGGAGGTGDVVAYAKEKGKPVLHMNTESLKVERIHFESML